MPGNICCVQKANRELLSQTHRNWASILLLWMFAVIACEGEQGWETGTSCQILSTPPKAKLSLRTGLCCQQGMSMEQCTVLFTTANGSVLLRRGCASTSQPSPWDYGPLYFIEMQNHVIGVLNFVPCLRTI